MKKFAMFLTFSVVFLNNYGLASAMPMGGFSVKAFAAQLCPDGSGLWCVAVDRPDNVGFHVVSPGSEIVYGPGYPDYPSVIKLKVVFPWDFDKWGIAKSDAMIAAYNHDTLPEKWQKLEYQESSYGFTYTRAKDKLSAKNRNDGTVQFYTSTAELKSGKSWLSIMIILFIAVAFAEAGYHFGQSKKTRQEYGALSIEVSTLFVCLVRPAIGAILWLGLAGISSVIFSSQATDSFGGNELSVYIYLFFATLLTSVATLYSYFASDMKKDVKSGGVESFPTMAKKMLDWYFISAFFALLSLVLFFVFLCIINPPAATWSIPCLAVAFTLSILHGRYNLRKESIAGVHKTANSPTPH